MVCPFPCRESRAPPAVLTRRENTSCSAEEPQGPPWLGPSNDPEEMAFPELQHAWGAVVACLLVQTPGTRPVCHGTQVTFSTGRKAGLAFPYRAGPPAQRGLLDAQPLAQCYHRLTEARYKPLPTRTSVSYS